MSRKKVYTLLVVVSLALLAVSAAVSQEGVGVITSGYPIYDWSLNPLFCEDFACDTVTGFLFPKLFAVDPATAIFKSATDDENALVVDWDVSEDGTVYTYHLRDNMLWSDGNPITAYDVFYTYLLISDDRLLTNFSEQVRRSVRGAVPLDDNNIAFIYDEATCSALDATNIPVIPAHIYQTDFAPTAAAFFADDGAINDRYQHWVDEQPKQDFSVFPTTVGEFIPTATHGIFQFGMRHYGDYLRLATQNGNLGFSYVDMQDYDTIVDQFLAGRVNLLQYVPFYRRDDLRAASDVQIFEYPSNTWVAISLNLANPFEPQSAFDEDGNRLEQGHHPIFGDVRVRRALQMALNVEQLIEVSTQGNSTIMPANQIPTSWAYNNDLLSIGYNSLAAERLLEEAGWKDVNRDGTRECIGCLYAREGTPLSFQLGSDTGEVLTANIQQQLRRAGVDVSVSSGSYGSTLNQSYDAFLTLRTESYPVDADQSDLFTLKGDVLGEGLNYGSYYNERVETLMQQVKTTSDCDYGARAQLYREVQTILQEDQPYLWLFTINDMIAVRGVQGFAPYPNAPFWNVGEWVIH